MPIKKKAAKKLVVSGEKSTTNYCTDEAFVLVSFLQMKYLRTNASPLLTINQFTLQELDQCLLQLMKFWKN
ncbi:hypothetical protein [Fischerella thermalis]|uniref:hypothetical protein n=1 Tax=Fischerella thermalis TaxID=372787 RepID=UPI0015E07930|nr:hypothetical protein [Fischerella thermalis]